MIPPVTPKPIPIMAATTILGPLLRSLPQQHYSRPTRGDKVWFRYLATASASCKTASELNKDCTRNVQN